MGDITLFGIPISLGTMIYQAIVFTILVYLIKKFVMKKLLNVMTNRQQYIEKQMAISELYKQEAEKKLKEQEELIFQAKENAKSIRKRSEKEARELFERTKAEAREIILDAKEEARRIRSSQNSHKGA